MDQSQGSHSATKGNSFKHLAWPTFGVIILVVLGLVVWKLPQRQTAILKQQIEKEEKISLSREKLFELENTIRENYLKVIQFIGGLSFILTGYFAWKNWQTAEKNRELAERTAEDNRRLTENKQVTERFSKAVELLSESEKLEARIGGIYLLERIAGDSPQDHPTVMEVLTAYIREKSPAKLNNDSPNTEDIKVDIQAVLTVLGRRKVENDNGIKLNLCNTNLTRAIFEEGGDFSGIYFNGSNLSNALLVKTNLKNTYFLEATLVDAHISGADLTGSCLYNANLTRAELAGTIFKRASFLKTNIKDVSLLETDFRGAKGLKHKEMAREFVQLKYWESSLLDPPDFEFLKELCLNLNYGK